jgi:hypothetical protein
MSSSDLGCSGAVVLADFKSNKLKKCLDKAKQERKQRKQLTAAWLLHC